MTARGRTLILVCAVVPAGCAQTPPVTTARQPIVAGSQTVGYRLIRTEDDSRRFGSQPARPIQIALWYPARPGTGTELRFGDYMAQIPTEGKPSQFQETALAEKGMQEFTAYHVSIGVSRSALDSIYRMPVPARQDAVPLATDAPMIIFAVGISESPAQHTALAEFLAAHGYVVAAIPTMGAQARDATFSVDAIQAHVADLGFVLRYLRERAGSTFEKVGAIGYSFGSGAAVLLAAAHPEIAAVVSLDGSIGFADRLPMYEAVPGFAPTQLCTPMLHVNVSSSDRNLLRAVSHSACGDRYVASFTDGNHLDFSSVGVLAGRFPSFRTSAWAFERSEHPQQVFESAARLVLSFFDAHVRARQEDWPPQERNGLFHMTATRGQR